MSSRCTNPVLALVMASAMLATTVAAACTITAIDGPQPRDSGLGYAGAAGTDGGDFYSLYGSVVEFYDVDSENTSYILGSHAPPAGGNTFPFEEQFSAFHQPATESLFVVASTGLVRVDVSDPANATGSLLVSTAEFTVTTKVTANASHVFLSADGCIHVVDPAAATPSLVIFAGTCGQPATGPVTGTQPGTEPLQTPFAMAASPIELVVFVPGQVLSLKYDSAVVSPIGDLPSTVTSVPAAFSVGQAAASRVVFFGPNGCTAFFVEGGTSRVITSQEPTPSGSCTSTTTLSAIGGASDTAFAAIGTANGDVGGFTFSCDDAVAAEPEQATPTGLPTVDPADAVSLPPGARDEGDSESDATTTIVAVGIAAGALVVVAIIVCVVVLVLMHRRKKANKERADAADAKDAAAGREPFERSMSTVPSTMAARAPPVGSSRDGRDSLGRFRSTPSTMERSRSRLTPGTANVSINMRSVGSVSSVKAELRQSTMSGVVVSAISRSDFSRPADRLLGQRAWTDAELRRHNKRCQFVQDGAYQKGKLIGRGANGSVYGVLLKDGSTIAMKEVNLMGSEAEIQEQMAEVEREMALLSQLHHDNLVTYYGVLCDRNRLAVSLFMENVTGGSLGGMSRSMDTPLAEVTGQIFTKQMLRGLAVLHEEGIVHRDLKCDNVLRDAHTGTVKLADFGTAKSVGNAAGASKAAQTMIGTPYFMAPEILAAGMGGSVDGSAEEEGGYGVKADVWSLGITVGELLNQGNPPWPAFPSPGHAFLHIANPESEPLLPEGLSDAAVDFIRQCTRRNPRERPTARELLQHPWIALSGMSGALSDSNSSAFDAESAAPDTRAGRCEFSDAGSAPASPTAAADLTDVDASGFADSSAVLLPAV